MRGSEAGRTIVIGADSLDLILVERWAAQGLLPFFASMLQNGSLVRLSAVSRVLQGAVWPSFLSGRSPGHHGTYYLSQLTNGTYDIDLVDSDHVEPDPYYGLLAANGVRCAIVDVPYDMPIKGFAGLHVIDWLTEFQAWRFATQPAASKGEMVARIGTLNETGGYGPTEDSLDGHRLLSTKLEKSLVMKSTLLNSLLERTDLDHIFVVYGEPHKGGHFLWKYMDTAHPDHVTDSHLRESLLGIYQLLDKKLSEASAKLTDRDDLVVFSDHGMQANYRGDHFIGTILERLGLFTLARRTRHSTVAQTAGIDRPASNLRSVLRALIMAFAPDSIGKTLRRKFGAPASVDWSRTRMFGLPTDRNSYLRVNLRGREPEGIVAPGPEYEELLTFIEMELRALVNPETRLPAVEAVFRVQELFAGPRVDDLPDLAVLWGSDAPIHALESPRLGRIEMQVREDRSGNHRPEGFLLARGPRISPLVKELRGDVLQVPGTLLALHGITCPDHYEMPPLHALLCSNDAMKRRRHRSDALAPC